MVTSSLPRPPAPTGLPPGVRSGPIGRRLLAHLIDISVPVVGIVVLVLIGTGTAATAARIIVGIVVVGWLGVVWAMYATRAAGPGMRVVGLQLVGYADGRPIGWSRFLVRSLVLLLLEVTVIGALLMAVFLLRHPRRQGWHDLATNAVVIRARMLAPPRTPAAVGSKPGASSVRAAGASAAGPSASSPPASDPSASGPPAVRPEAPSSPPDEGLAASPSPTPERAPTPPEPPRRNAEAVSDSADGVSPTPGTSPESVSTTWVALLDDGREIALPPLIVLGRNPEPRPGEEGVELLKITDETRTVSKSHLALGADEQGAFVADRGSTNGSIVTGPDGEAHRCVPHQRTPVTAGTIVSFGDHWLEIQRRAVPVVSTHAAVRP